MNTYNLPADETELFALAALFENLGTYDLPMELEQFAERVDKLRDLVVERGLKEF